MNRPLVEVCIGSLADAKAAVDAGADRLELCSATELGGLTPSAGLIEAVTEEVALPVMVMIRPRPGGFYYTDDEFLTAVHEAKSALRYNVAGIVFGFLHTNGEVDVDRCRQFVDLAGERQTVFHRALDVVPDALQAIDQLIEVGVTRVLTSGQQVKAVDGTPLIREMVERSQGRLQILPGGGIRADNVCAVIEQTGCDQVHIGASAVCCDRSLAANPQIDFHAPGYLAEGRHRVVDRESVAAVLSKLAR